MLRKAPLIGLLVMAVCAMAIDRGALAQSTFTPAPNFGAASRVTNTYEYACGLNTYRLQILLATHGTWVVRSLSFNGRPIARADLARIQGAVSGHATLDRVWFSCSTVGAKLWLGGISREQEQAYQASTDPNVRQPDGMLTTFLFEGPRLVGGPNS
jgi:hypothetical protein